MDLLAKQTYMTLSNAMILRLWLAHSSMAGRASDQAASAQTKAHIQVLVKYWSNTGQRLVELGRASDQAA